MRDLSFDDLYALAGGRPGRRDVACHLCGPDCKTPANRTRRVLRVWLVDDRFATFNCARCGVKGTAHAEHRGRPAMVDRKVACFQRAREASLATDAAEAASRMEVVRGLRRRRQPAPGTIVETYLREVRGYRGGLIPATLGFLPPRGDHPPAMIAAFGVPDEPEPGLLVLREEEVRGAHITRLAADGSAKVGDPSKIIIGRCLGVPIVLSALNDNLGMAITEGIEDGLSIFASTGLGVWAAGAAGRMPALAPAVPQYANAITVVADADEAGQRGARELRSLLHQRGLEAALAGLNDETRAAA
jgi:Toprim domain